jgi:D-arabinose 5-phosphate isomerase GutQ
MLILQKILVRKFGYGVQTRIIQSIKKQTMSLYYQVKASFNDITQQPMGSLFEQSVWLYGDLFVMNYMNKFNISEFELKKRHANLE